MRHPLVTAALALALLAPTPALAQESATPTVSITASPAPHDYCDGTQGRVSITQSATPRTITAGDLVTYTVEVTGPVNRVHLVPHGYSWLSPTQRSWEVVTTSLSAEQPGLLREVRDLGPGETRAVSWNVRLTGNTRLGWQGAVYCGPGSFHGDFFGPSAGSPVVDVSPRLTLDAVRHGVRDYTFSGLATRPGQLLNLYRVTATGREVLTSQTRASDVGTWSKRRIFLGSGRFGFVVRTGRDMANAPGASDVRATVIH